MKWERAVICGLAICIAAMSGCKSYNDRMKEAVGAYRVGQYELAAAGTEAELKEASDEDKLLIQLEHGATQRTLATTQPSNASFDEAEKLFAQYDELAKVRIDQELKSLLVNQTLLTYEGYGYDRIMMNVYKSLNYLDAGDLGKARVGSKRFPEAQAACEQRYRDKIEQAQKADQKLKEEKKLDVNANKTLESQEFQAAEDTVLGDFADIAQEDYIEDNRHRALYNNPFAEYLQGVFFLHSPFAGDAEVGRVAMRNALGMVSTDNLRKDVADAERIAEGARMQKVYVVFETGMAPRREEVKIRIPVFVFNIAVKDTKVDYFALAFPKLVKEDDYLPYVQVSTRDGNYRTQTLADMDRIVAREFKNDFPRMLTRSILSAVFKAAASYAAAEATRNQDIWVQVGVRGASILWQELSNRADTRTWRTLPKQIQAVSFPTPQNGRINITAPSGAVITPLDVSPSKSHLIWIRIPSSTARPMVRLCALN